MATSAQTATALKEWAVRVYRLPEPGWIVNEPHYSGCTAWITLEADLDPAVAAPVLDDAAYAARVAQIKAALA